MDYYVYAYLRDDGTPYYIGKGRGRRAWAKGKSEVVKPGKNYIAIIESRLTATGALAIERRLIRWYGRADQDTGILRNRTDGGDGGTGAAKGNVLSKETKEKISAAHIGRKRGPMSDASKKKLSESMKGKNAGKTMSDEHKLKIAEANRGKKKGPLSEETRAKIKAARAMQIIPQRSEEHKKAISIAQKGKPKSPEQVEKQRQSLIAYYDRKRSLTGEKPI